MLCKKIKYHCLFEQSGTFKNEFKKLGYEAYDYDILNDFGETDYIIDLFEEIKKGYKRERENIFDKMGENDFIIAFFPCVRFEDQILLWFKGNAIQQTNWTLQKKLELDLEYHKQLSELYELITKLVLICIERNIKLVIENPYSSQHYLTRYWALEPSLIDKNRSLNGDFYKKPTQYFFVNCEPKTNLVFEAYKVHKLKKVSEQNKVERSMISPEYANRFIREFII